MEKIPNSKNRELRLVVTQKCNYNCTFCHGEGLQSKQIDNLNPTDYRFLYKIGKRYFGLNSTTLSGGEPLVRKDVVEIAKQVKKEGAYITVVTNGALLRKRTDLGNYIDRLNVSLHTLDKEKYENLVQRRNSFEEAIQGIYGFAKAHPEVEIRLNAALVESQNTSIEKIREYIDFARSLDASIKYIELYPKFANGFFPLEDAINAILDEGFIASPSFSRKHNFVDENIEVGLSRIFCASAQETINPGKYCLHNNDLFVTPEGKFKPCREIMREVDFLKEVKTQDYKRLSRKIAYGFALLGKDCPLNKSKEVQ